LDDRSRLALWYGWAGEGTVAFAGNALGKVGVIGRGRFREPLPLGVTLRLERRADLVSALCSADGTDWYSVGEIRLDTPRQAMVCLLASGDIARTVYPGAFPDGSAVSFSSFDLWSEGA
jgi:hypothetical protein